MNVMKTICGFMFICLALVISGCASGYGKKSWRFGYSDRRVDDNTFLVSFHGNAYTSQDKLQTYVLLRCAEVAAEAGYDYVGQRQLRPYQTLVMYLASGFRAAL